MYLDGVSVHTFKNDCLSSFPLWNDVCVRGAGIMRRKENIRPSRTKENQNTAIEEDAQIIYKNFNAVVTMIRSNENALSDKTTAEAVKIFLRNIFDANVRIVLAYGLA